MYQSGNTSDEVDEYFSVQLNAYREQGYPSLEERKKKLRLLKTFLLENASAFEKAISEDFGYRSPHETRICEQIPSLEAIKFAKRHLKSWMKTKRRSTSIWMVPGRAYLKPQPLGVVGIIVPWNYPLLLCMSPLISAIAAGNRVMIKLSELTPNFANLFVELIQKYFDRSDICVVTGGIELARHFSGLPFQHLFFTGSSQVGKQVMEQASKNLTPVTLELGGKSPAIVDKYYPIEKAARSIVWGKLINAGQTCIAPDYVLVPKGKSKSFINAAIKCAEKFYPSNLNTDYTSIISEGHFKRLRSLIDQAQDNGAIVYTPEEFKNLQTPFLPFQLLDHVSPEMDVMKEELFGPILPIVEYESLEEAIQYVNERPRPLALYFFSQNSRHIDLVLNKTHSGGVTINDTLFHMPVESLPFGGVGESGMGNCHGEYGFMTFSNQKAVFKQARFNFASLIQPPYTKLTDFLIKLMS